MSLVEFCSFPCYIHFRTWFELLISIIFEKLKQVHCDHFIIDFASDTGFVTNSAFTCQERFGQKFARFCHMFLLLTVRVIKKVHDNFGTIKLA